MPKYSEQEKAERRAEYRRYLKSRTWAAIRGAAIYRAGGKCEHCQGTEDLHVHHKRYPRAFGAETPDMLQVLCDPCHAEEHGRPYIIHKLSREKRKARKVRLLEIRAKAREAKTAKRKARAEFWKAKLAPTPPLKDRFGGGMAGHILEERTMSQSATRLTILHREGCPNA